MTDDVNVGTNDETPEAAYRLLHARVSGAPPQSGDASISAAQYDAARAAHLQERGITAKVGVAVWPPTSQTIRARLGGGSWARAVESLGLTAHAGRTRGAGAFSDGHYLRAVGEFLTAAADDDDASVTSDSFAAYAAWAKGSSDSPPAASPVSSAAGAPRRPSGAAVRQHFGSWAAAKDAAAPQDSERP